MAAVVASHHPGLWQHRSDQHLHFPNMNMASFSTSYEDAQRGATSPPVSGPFQAASNHLGIHGLPMFSTQTMTTSVPYQSGSFAFDSLAANPYNMQQAFPVSYQQAMTQNVSYSGASDVQPLPIVRSARNGFTSIRNHDVKSETTSPIQSQHGLSEEAYSGSYKRSTSEPSESAEGNFATHVDTLMRAIQAKQSTGSPSKDAIKASNPSNSRLSSADECKGRRE